MIINNFILNLHFKTIIMSNNFKAGIIALIAIVSFILLVNFLKGENVFNRGTVLYAVYDDVHGLQETKPVTINGMTVGRVDEIDFTDDNTGNLLVQMTINTDFEFDKNTEAIIYEPGFMSGAQIKLKMSRKGDIVHDGDYIIGKTEEGMMSVLAKEAVPLKQKLENVLISVDSTLLMVRSMASLKNKKSIDKLVNDLDNTILSFDQMAQSISKTTVNFNSTANNFDGLAIEAKNMVSENRNKISSTFDNLNSTLNNFNAISEDINKANLDETVANLDESLSSLNSILKGVENGDGSLGKLMKNEAVYNNLDNATKELELLLRDIKENPKKYVHFSVFGKKDKSHNNEVIKNISEQ